MYNLPGCILEAGLQFCNCENGLRPANFMGAKCHQQSGEWQPGNPFNGSPWNARLRNQLVEGQALCINRDTNSPCVLTGLLWALFSSPKCSITNLLNGSSLHDGNLFQKRSPDLHLNARQSMIQCQGQIWRCRVASMCLQPFKNSGGGAACQLRGCSLSCWIELPRYFLSTV